MQARKPKSRTSNAKPSTFELNSYENIRGIVRKWPPAMRSALARDIIDTLSEQAAGSKPRGKTLRLALGLFDTGQTPPTDEQIEEMLEEARMEKYGR